MYKKNTFKTKNLPLGKFFCDPCRKQRIVKACKAVRVAKVVMNGSSEGSLDLETQIGCQHFAPFNNKIRQNPSFSLVHISQHFQLHLIVHRCVAAECPRATDVTRERRSDALRLGLLEHICHKRPACKVAACHFP